VEIFYQQVDHLCMIAKYNQPLIIAMIIIALALSFCINNDPD